MLSFLWSPNLIQINQVSIWCIPYWVSLSGSSWSELVWMVFCQVISGREKSSRILWYNQQVSRILAKEEWITWKWFLIHGWFFWRKTSQWCEMKILQSFSEWEKTEMSFFFFQIRIHLNKFLCGCQPVELIFKNSLPSNRWMDIVRSNIPSFTQICITYPSSYISNPEGCQSGMFVCIMYVFM